MEYQKGYRFKSFEDLEKFRLEENKIVRVDGLKGRFVVRYEVLNERDSWLPTDNQAELPPEISLYTFYTLKALRYDNDPSAYIWTGEKVIDYLINEDLAFFEIRTRAREVFLKDLEVTGRAAPLLI